MQELSESVWFKRYWLCQHSYINLNRHEIEELQRRSGSAHLFFTVIEVIFETVSDESALHSIIDHIQDNYSKLPGYIYGKIFLYHRLFEQFRADRTVYEIEEEKLSRFS